MVGNLSITFGQPWWLGLLLLVVPPLVWMSFRSLAGLGTVRRALAIGFRTAVIALIVLALAVDHRGEVSVIDSNNHRVQRFRL